MCGVPSELLPLFVFALIVPCLASFLCSPPSLVLPDSLLPSRSIIVADLSKDAFCASRFKGVFVAPIESLIVRYDLYCLFIAMSALFCSI